MIGSKHARFVLALGVATFLGSLASSCATTKVIPCNNDGECTRIDANLAYCSRQRCVECVTVSACGEGNLCVDGLCQRKCKDERECRDGERCEGGQCARP